MAFTQNTLSANGVRPNGIRPSNIPPNDAESNNWYSENIIPKLYQTMIQSFNYITFCYYFDLINNYLKITRIPNR